MESKNNVLRHIVLMCREMLFKELLTHLYFDWFWLINWLIDWLSSSIELPWDEPTPGCKEYKDWLQKKIQVSPWKKVDMVALGLSILFWFRWNRNLCNHDAVCVCVCMRVCVCVCVTPACKHDISRREAWTDLIWYVGVPYWVQEPYCFWWRSKVIWGQQGSNCQNLLNTISQEGKLGQLSYLISWCTTLSTKAYCF